MECNKEEALRAMELAEKKMEKKDFEGAKKIAEKAQRLHGDLPNVSQMILVCDVHCASQSKLYGNELDWYGVLQIKQAADEIAIKRQYRKLALSLHPDKNNFPGAADAFKMIGEASKVLTDKGKRLVYDNKCKAAGKFQAHGRTQNATRQTNARGHPWFQSSFPNNGSSPFASQQPPPPQPKTQPVDLDDKPKFWTVCPYCQTRFQYYRDLLNRNLRCQNCKKEFAGFEMSSPSDNPHPGSYQPVFPQPTAAKKGNSSTTTRKGNANFKSPKRGSIPEKKAGPGAGSKRGRKKRSHSEDFIDSTDSDSSSDISDDDLASQNFGSSSAQNLRRSARSRQQVSYDYGKDASDDDMANSDEIEVVENTNDKKEPAGTEENNRDVKRKKVSSTDEVSKNGDSSGTEKARASEDDEPREVEYPEPDFNNFDKEREGKCFIAGQMWAIYDTLDAMPRFYAIVRKVFSSPFSLRITWFEANPDAGDEVKWVAEGFPAACGKFRLGSTEVTDVLGMFSHRVNLEKGGRKDKYKMYPRKGETWAIFKEWDMKWPSDPQRKKEFEYEFVEVLSEYDDNSGTQVAYLGKLKGFSCLFCRIVKDGVRCFEIPAKDLFRFSHKVPSFQMTGNERPDVPTGSFELDPGSLPRNLEEIDVLTALSMDPSKMQHPPNGSCSKPMNVKDREAATSKYVDELFSGTSRIEELVADELEMEPEIPVVNQTVPEPEFYEFDADKAMEKFKVGQVWAVYGDEDALPKYYGKIRKVDSPPSFALHLTWLESLPPPADIIPWQDSRMHAGCGEFRLQTHKPQMFAGTDPFSHQVKAVEENSIYRIYPQKGEVWALYKDWKPTLKYEDLDSWDYEPVEVLFANEHATTVMFLEPVLGHRSVFKARLEGKSPDIRPISRAELLRFSHQIPAFQLTAEKNGSLRDSWELDSAALPAHFFSSS